MGALDDARQAGFSEDEIGQWANGQRDTWREAGFTDQEIDSQITGLKNPRQIPPSFLQRFSGAAQEGFGAGFGPEPIGISPEDEAKLSSSGIFHTPGHAPVGLQIENEAVIRPAYTAAEVLFRGVNGAIKGAGALLGEGVAEATGANEAETERAKHDFASMAGIAALLAGAHSPVSRAGVTATISGTRTARPIRRRSRP
jgi:hypothetical protein